MYVFVRPSSMKLSVLTNTFIKYSFLIPFFISMRIMNLTRKRKNITNCVYLVYKLSGPTLYLQDNITNEISKVSIKNAINHNPCKSLLTTIYKSASFCYLFDLKSPHSSWLHLITTFVVRL